jgi:hypothetical protein
MILEATLYATVPRPVNANAVRFVRVSPALIMRIHASQNFATVVDFISESVK